MWCLHIVLWGPFLRPKKNWNQTRPRLEKDRTAVLVFQISKIKNWRRLVFMDQFRLSCTCHIILLLIAIKADQKSGKSDESWVKYDQIHEDPSKSVFLPGFGHISLNFHLICQIVGSFSSQLVRIIYNQLIIIGLDMLKTCSRPFKDLIDQDWSRPVFCGFLRFFVVFCGLVWFFEVLEHWGTSPSLGLPKNSKKPRPDQTLKHYLQTQLIFLFCPNGFLLW